MDAAELRERIAQIDGGELTGSPRWHPFSVVFPNLNSRTILYTTKPAVLARLFDSSDAEPPPGIIGRYGLPSDEDVAGIARSSQGCSLFFLGDCDPFDLLVFAWLKCHLPIRFLGISDAVISAVGVAVDDRMTLPFREEDHGAMPLLREAWPAYAESIGPNCARLLEDGHTLELEALVSFRSFPIGQFMELMAEHG